MLGLVINSIGVFDPDSKDRPEKAILQHFTKSHSRS
jgi:hypothetical protein